MSDSKDTDTTELRQRKKVVDEKVDEIDAELQKKLNIKVPDYLKTHTDLLVKAMLIFEQYISPLLTHACYYIYQFAYLNLYLRVIEPICRKRTTLSDSDDPLVLFGVPIFCGSLLVLFGHSFPLLISSVEAFRISGYSGLLEAGQTLFDQAYKAWEQFEKDGGAASLKGLDKKEAFTRLFQEVMKAIDPNVVLKAYTHLATAFFAVLANLKMEFARVCTMGSRLGNLVYCQVYQHLLYPICSDVVVDPDIKISEENTPSIQFVKDMNEKLGLKEKIPDTYRKWIPSVVKVLMIFLCVHLAFFVQGYISGWTVAIVGGRLIADKGLQWICLATQKPLNAYSKFVEPVGMGIAIVGFSSQVWYDWGNRFPFYIVCLPFNIVETALEMAVVWF